MREQHRYLLDYNAAGMCLYCLGHKWHVSPSPLARVTRSGDGWTGSTPEEAMDRACVALQEQGSLPREEKAKP